MKTYNVERFDRAPALVVFDLDNTFYAYDPAHEAALSASARKATSFYGVPRETFLQAYEAARNDVKKWIDGVASSHSRLLYFGRVCERVGLGAQPAIVLDLEQTYWTSFIDAAVIFPDAIKLLDDLRLARIPCGLVTDLPAHTQYRKLVFWGMDQAFTAIVASEEAGRDKPDQPIFDLLAEKLGGLPEGRIWMIGDSLQKDIAAARRHMNAVTLLRCNSVPTQRPSPDTDLVFSDFREIRSLLARLLDSARARVEA